MDRLNTSHMFKAQTAWTYHNFRSDPKDLEFKKTLEYFFVFWVHSVFSLQERSSVGLYPSLSGVVVSGRVIAPDIFVIDWS